MSNRRPRLNAKPRSNQKRPRKLHGQPSVQVEPPKMDFKARLSEEVANAGEESQSEISRLLSPGAPFWAHFITALPDRLRSALSWIYFRLQRSWPGNSNRN